MLRENTDSKKILNHIRKGNAEALKEQMKKVTAALEDTNLIDSLKGVFTLTIDVKKQIENTRKDIKAIARKLTQKNTNPFRNPT